MLSVFCFVVVVVAVVLYCRCFCFSDVWLGVILLFGWWLLLSLLAFLLFCFCCLVANPVLGF